MTQQDRQAVAEKLFECAMYFGKHDLKKENVSAIVNVIQNYLPYPSALIIKGIADYMIDPKNKAFPSPAQLRPYIAPEFDTRDVAITLTRDLIRAIKSHQEGWIGGYWSSRGPYWISKNETYYSWEDAAQREIGQLGVLIVQRYGWKNLCDAYFSSDETTFNAQVRDYILSTQNLASKGHLDTKFALTESSQGSELLKISASVIKPIGEL